MRVMAGEALRNAFPAITMSLPMHRLAILASLLLAVTAAADDVVARSYDRVVVVAIDRNGDGNADEAYVAGLESPLKERVDLRWQDAYVEEREVTTFVQSLAPITGLAHYPKLIERLPLDTMPQCADDRTDPGWTHANLHANW
jgi:hypothetical protein